jgi:cell division protease FtsH
VEASLTRAKELLTEHRTELALLAKTLVQKETLDDNQIRELLKLPARPRTVD